MILIFIAIAVVYFGFKYKMYIVNKRYDTEFCKTMKIKYPMKWE